MLTYDSLIEQAVSRNMPPAKIRGILREYLQILILKELYRGEDGRKLYFTGGTYLRLTRSLKRFSEDLDFNIDNLTKNGFENLAKKIQTELKRTGLESRIEFEHRGNLYISKLIFPEVERLYNVISRYSKKDGITIKFETNRPKWRIKTETRVIAGFGEFYPAVCTDRGALFADKVDALVRKDRARHIYDIIFMLSNNYPIDGKVLKALGIKDDPLDVISSRIQSLTKPQLKIQAEALRPFLFEEREADLIINAHDIIPPLLEKYRQK